MASRKIEDCIPELIEKYHKFEKKVKSKGIDFILTCTLRTKEEQEKLYKQGRITPGRIVTWTLNSKHCEGKAFDIVLMKNGKPIWDMIDMNDNEINDWFEVGYIGKQCGLKWGGLFRNRDMCHFEVD